MISAIGRLKRRCAGLDDAVRPEPASAPPLPLGLAKKKLLIELRSARTGLMTIALLLPTVVLAAGPTDLNQGVYSASQADKGAAAGHAAAALESTKWEFDRCFELSNPVPRHGAVISLPGRRP